MTKLTVCSLSHICTQKVLIKAINVIKIFNTLLHFYSARQIKKIRDSTSAHVTYQPITTFSFQGSLVVIHCLKSLASDHELRVKWLTLLQHYGFTKPENIFVLEKICLMFVKSKQQIVREKFALKPKKGSVSLREELKGKKNSKSKEEKHMQNLSEAKTSIPISISKLRQEFQNPECVQRCMCEIVTNGEPKEILAHLTGRELTMLLSSFGKPGLNGKKKSRQIDLLLSGDTEFVVKFPEKVCTCYITLNRLLQIKIYYSTSVIVYISRRLFTAEPR